MTLIACIVSALIVGALVGGIWVAAVYERRNDDTETLPERDRVPFTGHVPTPPGAVPADDVDGAS